MGCSTNESLWCVGSLLFSPQVTQLNAARRGAPAGSVQDLHRSPVGCFDTIVLMDPIFVHIFCHPKPWDVRIFFLGLKASYWCWRLLGTELLHPSSGKHLLALVLRQDEKSSDYVPRSYLLPPLQGPWPMPWIIIPGGPVRLGIIFLE